jgi:hypothetical protein
MRTSFLFGAAIPALVSAACVRSDLQNTLDGFFQSAFHRASGAKGGRPSLSADAKITQNNILLKSLEDSAWGNTTSFYNRWGISVVDTEICEVACYCILNQKSPAQKQVPAILGIRIKTDAK